MGYSLLLFAVFGIMGPTVLHWIPAVMQWHGSSIVNGLAHYHNPVPKIVGYKNFETNEHSKNLPLFAYLTFGEGWHNNHHGKPTSYTFKHRWYEFDMVASILKLLSKIKAIKINE
jgi:stearoyl-CoA desaturase (delta-9 desaturase)